MHERHHPHGCRGSILLGVTAACLAVALASTPDSAVAASRAASALQSARRALDAELEAGLVRLGASKSQRGEIRRLLTQAAVELWGLRVDAVAVVDRGLAELCADEPDEVALDAVEKDGLALVAQGAQIARRGVLAATRVLTREQRARALAAWRAWKGRALPGL